MVHIIIRIFSLGCSSKSIFCFPRATTQHSANTLWSARQAAHRTTTAQPMASHVYTPANYALVFGGGECYKKTQLVRISFAMTVSLLQTHYGN